MGNLDPKINVNAIKQIKIILHKDYMSYGMYTAIIQM